MEDLYKKFKQFYGAVTLLGREQKLEEIGNFFEVNTLKFIDENLLEEEEVGILPLLTDLESIVDHIPIVFGIANRSTLFYKKWSSIQVQNNRISKIMNGSDDETRMIAWMIMNVRPLLHHHVWELMDSFLYFKRFNGTEIEKTFYSNTCDTVQKLIIRLIKKRPVVFFTSNDILYTREGKQSTAPFINIGTPDEKYPLVLEEYISYDEILLSSLVSVCVPTVFINDGNMNNNAEKATDPHTYTPFGMLVGMVGARFEKPNFMEWKHCIITRDQNTEANGYGKNALSTNIHTRNLQMWARFYASNRTITQGWPKYYFPSYQEAEQLSKEPNSGIIKIGSMYFNTKVYKLRLRYILEPFLIYANSVAKNSVMGWKAHVRTMGLGLGCWAFQKRNDIQNPLFMEVFFDILQDIRIPYVAQIDFCYIDPKGRFFNTTNKSVDINVNGNSVTCTYADISIATTIPPGRILVANYAWDGNAYPGNEYWLGMKNASMDPATACCSLISELQNPEINLNMFDYVFVSDDVGMLIQKRLGSPWLSLI
jgi:hypothetical protein